MTEVENHSKMDDPTDQFPVGMRVLAVDDDPICLRILEALLQKCQYHVTATKHAPTALQLLRENKDKFDLVISDVHMPDMDGFKLLELVGLEMDLPVIMLSVNGDPKMVLKGITHGACDYLLKPVRVEELRNIWQHVVRKKKKTVPKEGTKTGNQDTPISHSDNGQGSAATTNSDQNGKSSKKRKDLEEDDDNEVHENGDDSDDPSAQRKPRVVWSVDLHRKFVAAVNQLGLDKAVPKRILEMMNVDQLTRENVASHLQKYRLYLKRLSCVENQQANMVAALGSADPSYQQANMVAALGSADPSYLRTGSLSALGHLRTLNASRQFHNNAFRSFTHDGMISRMNTPSSMNVQGLPSSGTLQVIQAQNLNNSMNGSQLKFHSALIGGNQNDQLQHNKGVSHIQNLNSHFNAKPNFPITNQRQGGLSISNNALMLEMNPQHKVMGGVSTSLAPQQHSQFSLPLMDNGRLNDAWPSVFHSSGKNSYTPSERFGPASMTPTNNMNLSGAPSPNSLTDMHSKGVTFTNTPPGQISNSVSLQGWNNHNNLSGGYNSHVIGNSIGSTIPPNGGVPDGNASMNSTFNFGDPLQMKHDGIIELPGEPSLIPHQQVHVMNQQKPRHSRFSNSVGSLEELASAMMMKQNHDMYGFRRDNNHSGGGGAPL